MYTILRLVGVGSYMTPLMKNASGEPVNILKGDVIRVKDDVAGKIGGLSRPSESDNIVIHFFEAVREEEGVEVTHDFSSGVLGDAVADEAPADGGGTPEGGTAESATVGQRARPAAKTAARNRASA